MIPTRLGQIVEGCMFVGLNRIGNRAYALLSSPKSASATLPIKSFNQSTPGTNSVCDGFANTQAMGTSIHPAARYCKDLTINGIGGFYIPSLNELDQIYRVMKPSVGNYVMGSGEALFYKRDPLYKNFGKNLTSIPVGKQYTNCYPEKTIIVNSKFEFKERIASACGVYSSSTEGTKSDVYYEQSTVKFFSNGFFGYNAKTHDSNKVRPIRRQLIVEI